MFFANMKKILFVLLGVGIGLSVCGSAAFANERSRVLKLCETHRLLDNKYDCQCYADAFLKNAQGQSVQTDKIIMTAVDAQHCLKGDDVYRQYAACLNQNIMIDGSVKDYCQCFYDERQKNILNPDDFKNKKDFLMHNKVAQGRDGEACRRKFTSKNAPQYVGEAKVAQRLSDFAFSSVFDFDFYVCTDFGIANGQSDEKTNMRKFVNSFCHNVAEIRDSNPLRDHSRIISHLQVIQERLDADFPAILNAVTGDNKIYLQQCNVGTSCQVLCRQHQVNVGGVCPCGLQRLDCLSSHSLDMK